MTDTSPKPAKDILDLYFMENRARILDIASFLDRIDRYRDPEEARADFRYKALMRALQFLRESESERTKAIQLVFSDTSSGPVESAVGLKAVGAWNGAFDGRD
ncbi:MAG: hypothetical protein AB1805_01765 [Nitrospirota bacterium]